MGTETVEPAPSAQPEDADLTLDLDSLDVDSFAEEPLETAEPVEVEEVTDFDLEALTEEAPSEAPPSQELEDLEFADFDLEALPETGAETEPAPADDEFPEDTSAEIDLDEQMTEITLDDLPPEPAPPPVAPSADDSRALLQRIEHELAAIHAEIGDLKRELAGLRPRPSPAAAATDEEPSSFFAETEDEDETIALTGDELDNIMNTAEFTEEKGRPTEYEDLGGIALEEAGTEAEDLDLDILTATEETDQGMDTFAASEDHVEALASMDIDAELADIAELQDQTDVFAADGTEEPILDAEPLDLELEPEEEQPRQQAPSAPVDRGTPAVPAPVPPRREPDAPGHDPLQSPSPAPREPAAEPRLPDDLKAEMRSVLAYMDQLLEWLPQEKIQEFASSEHWRVYQRLFEELGLDQ